MRSPVAQRGVVDDALRAVGPDLTLLLGGIAAVVLLAVLWFGVQWIRRPPGVRFQRLLGEHDRIAVLMHPNPDPDAMSSALAVAQLAEAVDTEARLCYPGQIRHQENRAFRTVLDLEAEQIETADELEADPVVLVDHNAARGFPGADRVDPFAVVDHHPGGGEGEELTDVRTNYGACASILAEYLQSVGARPADDDEDDAAQPLSWEVATGLLYGIQSDTNHLTKGCTEAEFSAAAYLFPGIDEGALDRIANPQVSAETLEIKARAIREREIRGSFAIAAVGSVSNVDAIPQAADELLALEGITAVVVYGEHDGSLHLSGRSRDDRVHMGDILSSAVEDIPMASAGGHARMGGGKVSIAHMQGIGPSEGLTEHEFTERLFEALAGDI
ncbi:nanoRNase/pAp phosphatase, hydrolyzes c-di-AMP and oligoRNAs [Natronoarchaeum philippinense]|uniref:NanoRNase/pAp phosphatase, hydrolyzes c-di-AMP and oligoRNAs n=1 Tax=Natronoarchaeum philippinense TaxID=558529 RepID=A0A285NVJ5_NATPI|nr:bifunctional oligoribonuclease/PAP phosphatase NrnA [Natronoarchaeum philippinense]SNZ12943.1 nanoRNase/pAp phosphatase, hydrolyzes c-di-AMP and oligoRNAs [Natronoarchaeum philippinense]